MMSLLEFKLRKKGINSLRKLNKIIRETEHGGNLAVIVNSISAVHNASRRLIQRSEKKND